MSSNYTNSNHPTNRSKRNKVSNKQESTTSNTGSWVRPITLSRVHPHYRTHNKSKTYSNVQEKP